MRSRPRCYGHYPDAHEGECDDHCRHIDQVNCRFKTRAGKKAEVVEARQHLYELHKKNVERRMQKEAELGEAAIKRATEGFGDLIEAARDYLHALHAETNEPVCVPDALDWLRDHPRWKARVAEGEARNESRWTGQVFRNWRGWEKAGHEMRGSHGRPVQMWKRVQDE
jgi:hypothetical protein